MQTKIIYDAKGPLFISTEWSAMQNICQCIISNKNNWDQKSEESGKGKCTDIETCFYL